MLEMTCWTGAFHFVGLTTLGEAEMRAPSKGALAAWVSAGWGLVTGHDLLEKVSMSGDWRGRQANWKRSGRRSRISQEQQRRGF